MPYCLHRASNFFREWIAPKFVGYVAPRPTGTRSPLPCWPSTPPGAGPCLHHCNLFGCFGLRPSGHVTRMPPDHRTTPRIVGAADANALGQSGEADGAVSRAPSRPRVLTSERLSQGTGGKDGENPQREYRGCPLFAAG